MKISSGSSSGEKKPGDERAGSNESANSGGINMIENATNNAVSNRLSLYVANESQFFPPNTRMNRLAIHMPADDFIFEENLGINHEDNNYILAM